MHSPSNDHVFISYSRRDTDVMQRIVTYLRGQGLKAWVDNEKLVPGTPIWEREIEKALDGAFAVVVVLSPDAKESVWVLNELTLADEFKKRVFPVLVRGDFRESIPFRLATRQFVDLRFNEERGLKALSLALMGYLEELKQLEEQRKTAEREAEREEEAKRLASRKEDEERLAKVKFKAEQLSKQLMSQSLEQELAQEKLKTEQQAIENRWFEEREKPQLPDPRISDKHHSKDTNRENIIGKVKRVTNSEKSPILRLGKLIQPSLKWVFLGGMGVFIVSFGIWGFSNLTNRSSSTPSPEASNAIVSTPGSVIVTQSPSATSHPLTTEDIPCSECHQDPSQITMKRTEINMSRHTTGETFSFGTDKNCAGCHSGNDFINMIAQGQNPDQIKIGETGSTVQNCQTCHQIHRSNTIADWELISTTPVSLMESSLTFDGGSGNLCVNCHQSRIGFPEPKNGIIEGISKTWGHDYGSPSAMLLGVGGSITGRVSAHYSMMVNTCVDCHMGDADNHRFEPQIGTCQMCHVDAESYDINGMQTSIKEKIDQLGEMLVAEGVLSENSPEGYPISTQASEEVARALLNWLYIVRGDKSSGVHNPIYTNALLDTSIEELMK